MKVVFTGIQWCGKWTQSRILEQRYGFKLLEMWTEFRNIVKSGSELWNQIKEIIDNWRQVPEELWKKVMEEVLKTHTEENIIYDGFLRNSWNLEVFNKFIPEYKVVLFELDLIKARDRLYNRVYDPETGETFSSDIEINPKNGNKLIKREDDKDIESIKRRFNEFVEKTLPIIERQQEQWLVIEVNADQNIEKVTEELEKKLWLKK